MDGLAPTEIIEQPHDFAERAAGALGRGEVLLRSTVVRSQDVQARAFQ